MKITYFGKKIQRRFDVYKTSRGFLWKQKKKLLLMLWYRFINWQKLFFTFFCFSEFPTPHTWKEWDWFLKMFGIIWLTLLQINNSREWVKEHSHRIEISKSEKMVIFTYTLQIYHQCLNFCFGGWGMGGGGEQISGDFAFG